MEHGDCAPRRGWWVRWRSRRFLPMFIGIYKVGDPLLSCALPFVGGWCQFRSANRASLRVELPCRLRRDVRWCTGFWPQRQNDWTVMLPSHLCRICHGRLHLRSDHRRLRLWIAAGVRSPVKNFGKLALLLFVRISILTA